MEQQLTTEQHFAVVAFKSQVEQISCKLQLVEPVDKK